MWSSSGEDQHNSNKGLSSRGSSLSSSSTSSSASPSPFSSVPDHQRAIKTMEEVWKDITLSSLHDQPSRDDPSMTRFPGIILQDFLARPFNHKESHQVTKAAASSHYGSPTPNPPQPATMLTLNSTTGFHLLGNSELLLKQNSILQPPQHISNAGVCSPVNVPFDAFNTCVPPIKANGRKRCPEPPVNNSTDRRHKRMIKNRESAARSRARKQESFLLY